MRSNAVEGPIPHFIGGGGLKRAFTAHTGKITVSFYAASLIIPTQILTLCIQSAEETLL